MTRALSLVGLLLATTLNAGAVFLMSLLAAGGDGSATGVYVVQAFGALFVVGFFLVALRRWWLDLEGVTVAWRAIPMFIFASMALGIMLVVLRAFGLNVG